MFCDSNQSFQYTFTCLDLGSRKLQRGLVSWSAKNMLASCCFPLDWKNLLWLAKNLEENRASASSWDSSQLTYKSVVVGQFFQIRMSIRAMQLPGHTPQQCHVLGQSFWACFGWPTLLPTQELWALSPHASQPKLDRFIT